MDFTLEPQDVEVGAAFDQAIESLNTGEPFVYCKLNHGFWERLLRVQRQGYDLKVSDDALARSIDKAIGAGESAFVETGFAAELLDLLGALAPPSAGFHFAATIDPWPQSDVIEGTPMEGRSACLGLIAQYVPRVHVARALAGELTGHEFKAALIRGRFQAFSAPLAKAPFLLIANPQMAQFAEFIGANHAAHLTIDARTARWDRSKILGDAQRWLDGNTATSRIVLQAGGSLATWLCHHLFSSHPHAQIYDIGGAMSVCNRAVSQHQNFVRVFGRSLYKGIEAVHPGWHAAQQGDTATGPNTVCPQTQRNLALVAVASERGVAPPSPHDALPAPVAYPAAPVPFVENKVPDFRRIEQLMALSIRANHHANGGPVCQLLERAVGELLDLPSHRRVIACSSATTGLFLATGLHALRRGQPRLRWVASAFGFFSSNIGPLAPTRIIDCEDNGRFSLEGLKALPEDSWDGAIYTNVFGRHGDWRKIREFCRRAGKLFVIDNAVGLLDRAGDSHTSRDIEVISCHHTKPWGTGEGGFIILEEDDEADVRQLMNFAATMAPAAHPHALNGKLSDLAAAAILDRLERMAEWAPFYRMQSRRILSVVGDHGVPLVPLMGNRKPQSPMSYVPLLAPQATAPTALANPHVVLRKYYKPLAPTPVFGDGRQATGARPFSRAQALFERMVCCPANPELRLVSSEHLAGALSKCAAADADAPRSAAQW